MTWIVETNIGELFVIEASNAMQAHAAIYAQGKDPVTIEPLACHA